MKIWPFSKREQRESEDAASPALNTAQITDAASDTPKRPVYQKPALRRYDQIDQVKPYGPSEI